jgi:hypothetical protein
VQTAGEENHFGWECIQISFSNGSTLLLPQPQSFGDDLSQEIYVFLKWFIYVGKKYAIKQLGIR